MSRKENQIALHRQGISADTCEIPVGEKLECLSKRITPVACSAAAAWVLFVITDRPRPTLSTASSSCLPPQVRISHSSRTAYTPLLLSGEIIAAAAAAAERKSSSVRGFIVNHEKISFKKPGWNIKILAPASASQSSFDEVL